ncbi:hypothetical protein TNCV_4289601 [Trichonephila clavipes]|nr:hypothetical protein TNCV_4289601 [Trichonephila clavipes]
MSGNTCGLQDVMDAYRWAVMGATDPAHFFLRVTMLLLRQWHPNVPSHQLLMRWCRCKAKAGLRRSPRVSTTRTIMVVSAEIESGFVAKDEMVPFRATVQFPHWRNHQTESVDGWRQGQHT